MTTTIATLLDAAEKLWPISGQEDWDASGPIVGSPEAKLAKLLLCVDVTDQVLSEAVAGGFDAIVSHHPLLLRGVNTVFEDRFKGKLISTLIRSGCALISAHTNADRVETGTSVKLGELFGLKKMHPIVPNQLGGGIGVYGEIEPISLADFAKKIAKLLPSTAGGVKVAGDPARTIRTVSVCAGAGDSLLSEALVKASDVYVTSDLRHHPASEFREQAALGVDTTLIDISHWAAEWIWLETAASQLKDALPGVLVEVSEINTDPWTFAVVQ